jgi:hypothetical protein
MKAKFDYIFWGLMLILIGGLALAQQEGWIGIFSTRFWMIAFGAFSLIFFIRYFIAGLRNWGWLFPASGFAAVAATLWFFEHGAREAQLATPIFLSIIIPFLVAFILDIRRNWWALIPAFIMTVLCLAALFEATISGELIGALTMFSVAIPFAVVYLSNRERKWALVPAFTTAMLGIIILLSLYTVRWIGAFVPFAIAVPFFYVYFKYPQSWWALLPAGIMGSIGLNVLLSDPALGKFATSSFPAAVLFFGWAVTFYLLWRQREKFPTTWARIPAMILSIIAIILLITGSLTELGLVVMMMVGGIVLIYLGLRPRREKPVNSDVEELSQ